MIRKCIVIVLALLSVGLFVVSALPHHATLLKLGDLTQIQNDPFLRIKIRADGRLDCWRRSRTAWSPPLDSSVDGLIENPLPGPQMTYRRFEGCGMRISSDVWNVGLYQKLPGLPATLLGPKAIRTDLAVVIPLWMFAVLAGVYPSLVFIRGPLSRLVRFGANRYRRRHELCVNCCYNLTGNVSGVCPECGTEIPRGAGDEE